MFGVLPNWCTELLSMILIGLVIKWLDDSLDSEFDICRGERTLAARLGRSLLPYALCVAVFALSLDAKLASALFLSSYALGMVTNWTERLPTRLPPYVESVIAVLFGVLLAGPGLELWALLFIAWVDWLDDLVDFRKDRVTGNRNLAHKIGFVETTLLILLALLGSVWLRPDLTLMGFVAVTIVTVIAEMTITHIWTENVLEEGNSPHESD